MCGREPEDSRAYVRYSPVIYPERGHAAEKAASLPAGLLFRFDERDGSRYDRERFFVMIWDIAPEYCRDRHIWEESFWT